MNNRKIGAEKEGLARKKLEEAGYEILRMNYRCRLGEIDMISRKDEYLIFVEVKYRRTAIKGEPALAVNHKKQKKILSVARYYLYENGMDESVPCRFDVVAILGNQIQIIENAFEY